MELLTIRPLRHENIISCNIKLLLYYIFILCFPFQIKPQSSNVMDNHYCYYYHIGIIKVSGYRAVYNIIIVIIGVSIYVECMD